MSACKADIICITQITLKEIYNVLLVNNWRFSTIGILARKAFKDDWFNKEYNLNITEAELIELLEGSTKNQLFQFQGALYEQVDGVAMGLACVAADSFPFSGGAEIEQANEKRASEGARLGRAKKLGRSREGVIKKGEGVGRKETACL